MLRANGGRLKASLLEMGKIGGTAAGGVTRLTLSDADKQARDLFAAWARDAGLSVRVDDLGNQYARLEGSEPSAPPVLLGSHLDTVPAGGKFDGAFGVLTALEVARTLRDAGVRTRRSIEVVNFTNEEGARFEPAMIASGTLAGQFAPDYIYDRRDREGRSFGEELDRIGYRGSAANRPEEIHAYIETHIEQGPVLEAEGLPLAAVEGVLGLEWVNVTFKGLSQHAGPSPMRSRRDAMVAAARAVVALRDLALEYPDPAVVTVGRFQPIPGVINQIPGEVIVGIDMRLPSAQVLDEVGERARGLIQRIATEEKVDALVETIRKVPPTIFDRGLVELIEAEIVAEGLPRKRMTSGAGHDAVYINEIAPTAMLFVRTVGGKSHCETEAINWEDAQQAADVLLRVVMRLAGS